MGDSKSDLLQGTLNLIRDEMHRRFCETLSSKVILSASLIVCSSVTHALAAQLPVVDILYPPGGSLLDRLCRNDLKRPFDEKALQAVGQQRSEFQKRWDTEGPSYMNAAFDQIGLDFPYREMQATLTVCLPVSTSIP